MRLDKEPAPTWLQRVILGNADQKLGALVVEKLAVWVQMSRHKHDWETEVDGNVQIVLDALQSELGELSRAVTRNDPDEHVITEILDLITVALRLLVGEHLLPKEQACWLATLKDVTPTQPGEIGPYDEHKGGYDGAA